MVIKTASPGVIINEVDLTKGTSDAISTNVGGMVGPFARGPVDELVLIETEAELQKVFGDPTPENVEYWYTVSDFLEYGGVCYVIRCDDASGGGQTMKNAVSNGAGAYIKNYDDFEENTDDGNSLGAYFAARTPGAFGNNFGVAVIDAGADQQLTLATTGQLNSTGGAAGTATRFSTAITAGSNISSIVAVQAPAFVAPAAFAPVAATATVPTSPTGAATVDGVTLQTGDRVLLTAQTNEAVNGIFIVDTTTDWTRATDADADSDFEFGKPVTSGGTNNNGVWYYTGADNPTVGTTNLTFSQTNPAPDALSVGEYVVMSDATSGTPSGIVIKVDAASNLYYITQTGDNFANSATLGTSKLVDANGQELTGAITVQPELVSTTELYEQVTADNNSEVNVINDNVTETVSDGAAEYGWTKTPFNGQTVKTTAGVPYIWVGEIGLWRAVFEYAVGEYLSAAGTSYVIDAAESWYDQQIAFEGIPWYRFAPRPLATFNALQRGAKNDGLNIIVYDATGDETGSKGNMLESYFGVSKLSGTITPEGDANYYHKVINEKSGFIYAGAQIPVYDNDLNTGHTETGKPVGDGVVADYVIPQNFLLSEGVDQLTATLGERQIAYNKFAVESVDDLDYIMQGPANGFGIQSLDEATSIGNFLISIAEQRKDCMVFLSPPRYAVLGDSDYEKVTNDVVEWADTLSSSSFAVFDSGYKYTYDRWNDEYVYVPLNGDTAGTTAYTAIVTEPFYSPAGMDRGQIRGVVKLPYSPSKPQRDQLYTSRVNPVVRFPGEGTVLFGDKTGLAYSSAFDRINVRRLFLVIEKEVAEIARTVLFEFNDNTTRTLFKNNVNPFLRDIQSKRGMTDFLVVCDESNNGPEIIDRNEFVADIYIKPARSINFVTLNFIATKTGPSFQESIGLFRVAT